MNIRASEEKLLASFEFPYEITMDDLSTLTNTSSYALYGGDCALFHVSAGALEKITGDAFEGEVVVIAKVVSPSRALLYVIGELS